MSIDQRITVSKLQAEGFTLSEQSGAVLMSRNNDHRLIHADGSQHRAQGAKK